MQERHEGKRMDKDMLKTLFRHIKTNSLMIIYVDDFRMVAKPDFTPRLWGELRKVLHLDEPEPPGRFLGCCHNYFTSTVKTLSLILSATPSFG